MVHFYGPIFLISQNDFQPPLMTESELVAVRIKNIKCYVYIKY